ncbi:hypothetical protein ncot_02265 [Nocardioides sp. JQ2195]|uniref:hypothetical protein n=1 Tax=Nocardioides sp. JQ2195 TaxID=2592334 RepID=UPI00143E2434|nr:hypothetical protein [Nocardioides sp. JQ2195]QIX25546.1 hypothetical protein ncot_02265 [Nocardioides sp. JQ2195]
MRSARVFAIAALLLASGCASSSSDPGDDCTSHHEQVSTATTRAALEKALLNDVNPRVRSLRMVDSDPADDKTGVNLVDGNDRLVMSLDMWRRPDGAWTAQRWSQCID